MTEHCAEGIACEALRTPPESFTELDGYPFVENFLNVDVDSAGNDVRMHYVDEGPRDAPVVLMLHGEPTWSYLYRKMIPVFVRAGLRAIAPDHLGFGKSDKPADSRQYTFERHIGWAQRLVEGLDLRDITLVCQDWGGPIGMALAVSPGDRFSRVVAGNTMLHTCASDLADRVAWNNHDLGENDQCVNTGLLDWIAISQRMPEFTASNSVAGVAARGVSKGVLKAYDAPFPSEAFKQGMRQFPILIPITRNDPGAAINRRTFEALRKFERPFLTLFGDSDPSTRGWETIFQQAIPGAAGQPHAILKRAGHFFQEDCGEEAAEKIVDFIAGS